MLGDLGDEVEGIEDARAPPVAPPIRELTYVSDLEFVGDPGPAEPVWSPD